MQSTLTPQQRYQLEIDQGHLRPDSHQAEAMVLLSQLHKHLLQPRAWWQRLSFSQSKPPTGVYLWGGVGIGKTCLMDLFCACLPSKMVWRSHFHHFMQQVHERLTALQGQTDPLECIAQEWASRIRVLCFDEFLVNDITDAMLLAELLRYLFDAGVAFVATSNVVPDELYRNGLQRQRFLPAIELIKRHTTVLHMQGEIDYRLEHLEQAELFHTPITTETDDKMTDHFHVLVPQAVIKPQKITVLGREIQTLAMASDVIWFDALDLLFVPRSQRDYLEIACLFQTVLISGLPIISAKQDNLARNFINCIDVFYDQRVKLILQAAAPVEALYPEGRFAFEFQRTCSRLLEMQSHAYLHQPHGGALSQKKND